MPKIIVPVGYPMGVRHPIDEQDEPAYFEVLVARDQAKLSEPASRLWSLAFGDPDAHRELRFTRQHLEQLAANASVDASMLDELIKGGLLVEYDETERSSVDFLKRHNLHPTATGVGNTPEDPSMFKVAVGNEVVLTLQHDLFVLWSGSIRFPSLWDSVRDYSKHRGNAPMSTNELGILFAATIPAILTAGAGYLDIT
ncbi:hypothetical protein [Fodinicola acaciae]|uniref:hypothetical protein n=1 Tax=Fodinicola acaciae TaxID=2681555 RepID=UPI0013D58B9A|nr:hypothetical protein [Fodinicola acaciae]